MGLLFHLVIVVALTMTTQIGGVAWLLALWLTRRLRRTMRRLMLFAILLLLAYGALWTTARAAAPLMGRVAIPCRAAPGQVVAASIALCAMNRTFVTPTLFAHANRLSVEMDRRFPGTITQALDAGFPFFNGFPLLPHLSHDDGLKLDLAFYYMQTDGTYTPGTIRSRLGYGAFENPTGTAQVPCAGRGDRLTLRWDWDWLQPWHRALLVDETRTKFALRWLVENQPPGRTSRIFVEPHLAQRWDIAGPTVGFQGCRAARHDDHIHLQISP